MKKKIFFISLMFLAVMKMMAQEIKGKIITEDGVKIENVLIINIKNNEKTYSNAEGYFKISARNGEEIRLVKRGYERFVYIVKEVDFQREVVLKMNHSEITIDELILAKIKLTGDLAKDTKALNKESTNEKLQKSLGIATIEKQVKSLGSSGISFDPNNLFGKQKRQKKILVKYENQENNAEWIKIRIDENYFTEKGVPRERIMEFISFALTEKSELSASIKRRNITQVRSILEQVFPIYLKRLRE